MKKTFNFGLCLAGAVSAGAYTAGVLDYLFEALDRWEAARKTGLDVPKHHVNLNVINGTSAGGMTAIIATRALHNYWFPVTQDKRDDENYKAKNLLYNAWVNLDCGNGKSFDFNQLLDTSDLKTQANSLVNADFVDDIAKVSLQTTDELIEKSYLHPNLELLVTLTNLIGHPYQYKFRGAVKENDRYITSNHIDYYHFMIENGTPAKKGRMPLNFKTGAYLKEARDAAIATGAFPIGLKARELRRDKKFINDNEIINYCFPEDIKHLPENIRTINVDGGVVNNEPFEITEKILSCYDQNDAQDASSFSKFQILIDPFPTTAINDNGDDQNSMYSPNLANIVIRLLNAMRSQLLFKPSHIEAIFNENNYSRYIIAPVNEHPEHKEGEKAIACGSLAGFSGFLDKRLREHDFYLGRRNCQKFLSTHLSVPVDANNEIINYGYYSKELRDRFTCKGFIPIIPDILPDGKVNSNEEAYFTWPQIEEKDVIKYKKRIGKRISLVIINISKVTGLVKWVGLSWLSRKSGTKGTQYIVQKLKDHLLIKE